MNESLWNLIDQFYFIGLNVDPKLIALHILILVVLQMKMAALEGSLCHFSIRNSFGSLTLNLCVFCLPVQCIYPPVTNGCCGPRQNQIPTEIS